MIRLAQSGKRPKKATADADEHTELMKGCYRFTSYFFFANFAKLTVAA
jgi:hypothetical protein